MNEFKREPRYVVFKIKDIEKYLTPGEKESLMCIGEEIACARADDGKPPFNAVVVEQDWPEFEMVWSAIEARMTANSECNPQEGAKPEASNGVLADAMEDDGGNYGRRHE